MLLSSKTTNILTIIPVISLNSKKENKPTTPIKTKKNGNILPQANGIK